MSKRKRLTRKEKDANAFESVLTAKNKEAIERILSSIDGSSRYCARRALDSLELIIGKRATVFLINLLEANNTGFIQNIKEISPKTRKYLSSLYAIYAYKLHGILDGSIAANPNTWRSVGVLSVKYDVNSAAPFVRIQIIKDNRESMVIEDSFESWLELLSHILTYIEDQSSEMVKFQKNLGVEKKTMKRLRKIVDKLDKTVSPNER